MTSRSNERFLARVKLLFFQDAHGGEALHLRRVRPQVRPLGREEAACQGPLQSPGGQEAQAAATAATAAATPSPPRRGRGRRN